MTYPTRKWCFLLTWLPGKAATIWDLVLILAHTFSKVYYVHNISYQVFKLITHVVRESILLHLNPKPVNKGKNYHQQVWKKNIKTNSQYCCINYELFAFLNLFRVTAYFNVPSTHNAFLAAYCFYIALLIFVSFQFATLC